MPENDFEKNVKDKMDGFNLNPSADLWNKVESRIRKDKKRRFIIWWPLALLLLGGGTGLAIWLTKNNSNKQVPVSENKSEKIEPNNKPTDKILIEEPVKEPAISNVEEPKTNIPVKKEKTSNHQVRTSSPFKVERKTGLKKPTKNVTEDKKEINQPNNETIETKTEVITKENKVVDTKAVQTEPAKEGVVEKKLTEPLKEPVTEKIDDVKPVASNKKIKIQQPKQWGVGVSAGASAIVYKLGIGGNRDVMFATPGGTGQLATYRRPQTKRSFSFSAQAFWKHRLSPRLNVIGTIGYQYLSTRMLTGERVDTSTLVNNYYSPNLRVSRFYRAPGYSNNINYTNQFHFLNLGGELSWRFTGEKSNIRWNNGLSYDRLLTSSMLHYDGTIQGFYKDNNRLRKDHIFFNTSLSIQVGKRFELHPFASQSLTSVYNTKDSASSTYSNFGLRVRYLFNKKK